MTAESNFRWAGVLAPVVLTFVVSMVFFEFSWGGAFYSAKLLGHDFTLTGPGLLEGRNWIASNGLIAGLLNPPWFTPAWCAGTAFFADPQSVFYSPLQWFAFVVDPFKASHLNSLLFAMVAYWGAYALARRIFHWDAASATVFAVLGIANSLMPLHAAIGEIGYQPLYLWALLAMALCWRQQKKNLHSVGWPSIAVALVLTAWLQFGYGGMLVPTFMGTLLLCLSLVVYGYVDLWTLLARCAVGGVLAILINIGKLYVSISLLANFPRNFYAMPGFLTLRESAIAVISTLIGPSEWTYAFGRRYLVDVQFSVFPHEWAMQFGLGALAACLLGLCGAYFYRDKSHQLLPLPSNVAGTLALISGALIAAIPFLLLWSDGGLRELIKQIPILSSTTWPMRWIVILLPLTQVLLAWPLRCFLKNHNNRIGGLIAAFACLLIWLGPLFEAKTYYRDAAVQGYDTQPVKQAFIAAMSQPVVPIVRVSANPADMNYRERNDLMLEGTSQGFCYNPLYGYRLESFPQMDRLRTGAALSMDQRGQSLIYNPACLVHPKENACSPGDGFDMNDPGQVQSAHLFLDRKPYNWQQPLAGKIFGWISRVTLFSVAILLLFAAWRWMVSARLKLNVDRAKFNGL